MKFLLPLERPRRRALLREEEILSVVKAVVDLGDFGVRRDLCLVKADVNFEGETDLLGSLFA